MYNPLVRAPRGVQLISISNVEQQVIMANSSILNSCSMFLQDILWKIHALMPMQDAARAACLSHSFLHSWRCYPKLIFDMRALRKQTKDFINRVDHIMQNHSGVGVEIFKLQTRNDFSVHPSYLDRWLEVALTPGIKEFVLGLPIENEM
jgi:hypothetical protein